MIRFAINQFIKASSVRVILNTGENLGVLTKEAALKKAGELGKDLVQIVPDIDPPICKILDYKKFLYLEKQKHKKSVAGSRGKGGELKELRFGPTIGKGDLDFRIRRANEWLKESNKVKFTIQFKGREASHPEVGLEKMRTVTKELAEFGQPDGTLKREGNRYSITYIPANQNKYAKNKKE